MALLVSDLIPPSEPRKLGRFVVLRRLDRNGFTETLLARDSRLPRGEDLVVLERVPASRAAPGLCRKLVERASVAALLDHPGIVGILDAGTIDGSPFVATEHVPGTSLERLVPTCRPDLREALVLAEQVCEALHFAHVNTDEDGTPLPAVHGSVGPANVLVSADGRARVRGFAFDPALACEDGPLWESRPELRPYLAPERLDGGPATVAGDVYGCGALVHFLVAGRPPAYPPEGTAAGRSETPPEVERIVRRAMETDPAARHPSCRELAEAIHELVRALPTSEDEIDRAETEPAPAPAEPAVDRPKGDTLVRWAQPRSATGAEEDAAVNQTVASLDDIEELPSLDVLLEDVFASAKPAEAGLPDSPAPPSSPSTESVVRRVVASPPPPDEVLVGLARPNRPSAGPPPWIAPAPWTAARTAREDGPSPGSPPPPPAPEAPPLSGPGAPIPMEEDPTQRVQALAADRLPAEVEAALELPPPAAAAARPAGTTAKVRRAPSPARGGSRLGGVLVALSLCLAICGVAAGGVLLAPRFVPSAYEVAAQAPALLGLAALGSSLPFDRAPGLGAQPAAVAPSPRPASPQLALAPSWPPAAAAPLPAESVAASAPPAAEPAPAVASLELATPAEAPAPRSAPERSAEREDSRRSRSESARSPVAEPVDAPPAAAEAPAPEPVRAPAAATAGTGTLSVLTTPHCRVYMNSRLLGTSPMLGQEVPAGRHTLHLVAEDGGSRRLNVLVRPGQLTQVRENLWQ